MKIAISGATGLIGSALKAFLLRNGHEVDEISRHRGRGLHKSQIFWNPDEDYIDIAALEGHDVIVHLAGSNISVQSWSATYKKEILSSRVKSTKLLVDTIQKMNKRPKIFFCASAVGYYGNQDPYLKINERSLAGQGFLPKVCQEWENASADLILYGVRLVHMRFGIVLSKKGGALAKMLPLFYFGLGGRWGLGHQKMSWIALEEIGSIVEFIMSRDGINGPVNFTSPNSVTNREFTKILGKVIFRPTLLPVPAFVIRWLFGEMGQAFLLDGCDAIPEVLQKAGYQFNYPDLRGALQQIIKSGR